VRRRDWAYRVVVLVVVAAVVMALAAAVPLVTPDGEQTPEEVPSYPEYDTESLAVTPVPAAGTPTATADGDGDIVVIDTAHGNRIDKADLYPITSTVTRAGGSVRFHDDGDLNESLASADAFVVVDPQMEYSQSDLAAVEQFTDEGGRLLLAAEPDRKTVSGGLFGTTIGTTESSMTAIGSAYGISFDSAFLYNVGANEGNYEHVSVESNTIEGLDRGAVYTAAAVQSAGGRDVLVTAPDTRRYGTDQEGRFAVAVRSGQVLALGDSSLLATDRASVADNEAVVGYVVDFLLSAERVTTPAPTPAPGNETTNGATNETAENATTTAAAPPA
jgi:hypothetical protein